MDNRFIVFIIVSAVILYLFNYMVIKNVKKDAKNVAQIQKTVEIEPKNTKREEPIQQNYEKLDVNQVKIDVKTAEFENSKYKVKASSQGAKITKLEIKREGFDEENNMIDYTQENNHMAFNMQINGQDLELDTKNWGITKKDSGIEFNLQPVKNLLISKELVLNEKEYTGKYVIKIENNTSREYEIQTPVLNWGPEKNITADRYNQIQAVVFNGVKIERIKAKKKNEKLIYNLEKGWAGMRDQYFCILFYGNEGLFKACEIARSENQALNISLRLHDLKIAPGQQVEYTIQTYIGPQTYQELKSGGHDIYKVVDFGIFRFLAVPIYYLLKFLYQITKNYGVAIILLTIIIRALLWWPTQRSYTSMKKMQTAMNKMQPRLKTIKEIYRDNPQKLNEETMKLYKEYQINPMGGCLPMLLQMPVFFALYSALTSAVELKGAEFVWFWKDLSAKDPVYVLPLLMGLSMFIQQKMSSPPAATPEAATQQKMMLYMMPAMLTFFAFMWPSGLLLYWVVSNMLSIGQQFLINRKA
ncbi:membrane protein insertase YidC [candidate division FCPU426 bacterium]|nr:membrane protein insertase YidC [candidate division FCPU426 bacterium]